MKKLIIFLAAAVVAAGFNSCGTSDSLDAKAVAKEARKTAQGKVIDQERYDRLAAIYEKEHGDTAGFYKELNKILLKMGKDAPALKLEPVKAKKPIHVALYLDNTASMKGYIKPENKNVSTEGFARTLISLKNNYDGADDTVSCYYIDKKNLKAVTPTDLNELISSKNLTMGDAYSFDEFVGRIGIGKIDSGSLKLNQDCVIVNHHDPDKMRKVKVSRLYEFDGLNKVEVQSATIGSIVAISGISELHIGDTICSPENVVPIPFQKISEPTIAMQFMVNDSPLAGQEGKFVTSRHLRDRLFRELNTDVSLRVEETDSPDRFKVSGRGELHLSVLIENMRREGFEFAVSKAEVLYHTDENGKKLEPMELAYIDVPNEFAGAVIEKLGQRKGELRNMGSISGGTYTRLEFSIPARGLIGYRGEFMTDTKGNGILNTVFDDYGPYKGDIQYRKMGSLIAFEAGEAITYGLYNAQERGTLFIGPGEKVYSGMVIGQTGRSEDIEINVCKKKQLTNTRASGSDDALRLVPPKQMSLEQCLEFLGDDELLEVTPQHLRLRKRILSNDLRMKTTHKKK